MASCENFENDTAALLAADVFPVDTTIEVKNEKNVPTPDFRIVAGAEIMLVTGVVGSTWTVTRALEGTTADFHATDDEVRSPLTLEGLFNFLECFIDFGAIGDLPSPGIKGRLYLQDDPGWYIFHDNFTEWTARGGLNKVTEPDETGFSWVNQGSASTDTTDGGVQLITPAPGAAGENVRIRVESAPATPYTLRVAFIPTFSPEDQTSAGLIFRRSTGGDAGKFIYYRIMYDTASSIAKNDIVISIDKFSDPMTFDSNYSQISGNSIRGSMIWFQMEDDGVDLKFSISSDGKNYTEIESRSRTDFMTGGPEQIGYAVNSNTTAGEAVMTVLSYETT